MTNKKLTYFPPFRIPLFSFSLLKGPFKRSKNNPPTQWARCTGRRQLCRRRRRRRWVGPDQAARKSFFEAKLKTGKVRQKKEKERKRKDKKRKVEG